MESSFPSFPVAFVSHGAGPNFYMANDGMMAGIGKGSAQEEVYRSLGERLTGGETPRAIVVVSAHWEMGSSRLEDTPEVGVYHVEGTNTLLYDYSGFPKHTYELEWPAPGSPEVAGEVVDLLEASGFAVHQERRRGLDHGVFVPLKLMFPDATIPTLEISVHASLNAEHHLRLGHALAPLASRGVLLIGSGEATHGSTNRSQAKQFVRWLEETLALDKAARWERLAHWDTLAPHARIAHPREDHLMPLHVVAAAAADGDRVATKINDHIWHHHTFGALSFACFMLDPADPAADPADPAAE